MSQEEKDKLIADAIGLLRKLLDELGIKGYGESILNGQVLAKISDFTKPKT